MEIEDHGKERRNALAVTSSIFAAGFLQLKIPSFVSEFVKVELPGDSFLRTWLLAGALVIYVTMRYHFSEGRAQAREAGVVEFATWLVKNGPLRAQHYRLREEALPQMQAQLAEADKRATLSLHDIRPVKTDTIRTRGPKFSIYVVMLWELTPSANKNLGSALGTFRPAGVTETSATIGRAAWIRFCRFVHQSFWSKGVWEVNVVYALAGLAFFVCASRAWSLWSLASAV